MAKISPDLFVYSNMYTCFYLQNNAFTEVWKMTTSSNTSGVTWSGNLVWELTSTRWRYIKVGRLCENFGTFYAKREKNGYKAELSLLMNHKISYLFKWPLDITSCVIPQTARRYWFFKENTLKHNHFISIMSHCILCVLDKYLSLKKI